MAIFAINAMSVAICGAFGIDPDTGSTVSYHHEVGKIPTVTVTYLAYNADTKALDDIVKSYHVVLTPLADEDAA